ncbi:hypothetical protein ACWGPT_05860 [Pseudorhizobium sp. NPDC055634]
METTANTALKQTPMQKFTHKNSGAADMDNQLAEWTVPIEPLFRGK